MYRGAREVFSAYKETAKLRIVNMVLVTTTLGYVLGAGESFSWILLLFTLIGTGAAAAGSAVLNNYLERDSDALMERTRARALPSGRIEPAGALAVGVLLVLGGVVFLATQIGLLCGFLVLLTAFLYVVVYTPLKKVSWINTPIGAIPGAMPPLNGWAAAAGVIEPGAWILFLILFAWQHPHFYAIAWMYKDDYAKAGLKMLPVIEPAGDRMFRQVVWFCIALLSLSLVPTAMGLTGTLYLLGALAIGFMFLWYGMVVARTRTIADARKLLRASIIYLPALLALIVLDLAI
jgi:protoheme IX farnesyltransferase